MLMNDMRKELAKTGRYVTRNQLMHWERIGLITLPERLLQNKYRIYDEGEIDIIAFIIDLLRVGFLHSEVKKILCLKPYQVSDILNLRIHEIESIRNNYLQCISNKLLNEQKRQKIT